MTSTALIPPKPTLSQPVPPRPSANGAPDSLALPGGEPYHDSAEINAPGGRVRLYTMRLTPEIAQRWLDAMPEQRLIRQKHVDSLAWDMTRKLWRFNGQTIVINDLGYVIDGQHRLRGVIQSGETVLALVVVGVEQHAYDTLDNNTTRTAADTLAHDETGAGLAGAKAAGLRIIHLVELGLNPWHPAAVSNPQIRVLDLQHHEFVESLLLTRRYRRTFRRLGLFAAIHYLCARRYREATDEFFTAVAAGTHLDATDPEYLLRERLLQGRPLKGGGYAQWNAREHALLFMKAWNARRSGRRLSVLRLPTAGQCDDFRLL